MKRVPLVLLAAGCGATLDFSDQTIPTTDVWGSGAPSEEQLARYESARAYAEDHRALAMLVIEGTDIVYEWSRDGYDPTTPRHLFSGTKSFSCAVAETLVEDGLLDLDAPVADSIPELMAGPGVTARHLLHFTSGIEQRPWKLSIDGLRKNQRVADKYALAVGLERQGEPGETFEYGSSHLMVFGEQVSRIAERNALEVLKERIFEPMAFRVGGWHHDPAGNPLLPYGAWTTVHEWAKYGVLLRDDGVWAEERLLPAGVRERCTTGSTANPAYGLTWWLNQSIGEDVSLGAIQTTEEDTQPILHPGGYPDAFFAAGHDDQRLYVFPSEDVVVVLLSDGDGRFRDRAFATRLLP